jgi:phosphoglycerol transferase MdoB-like AlkP superfamily enzyme
MPRPVFVPTALLALVFVAAKIGYIWPFALPHELPQLLTISAEDVAVALGFGAVAWVTLRITSGQPRVQRLAWLAFVLCGMLAAVYAIVNIGVYRSMRQPLNFRMLELIGRVDNLRSSIEARADFWLVMALLGAPALFALSALGRLNIAPRPAVKRVVVAVAAVWIAAGAALRAGAHPDSHARAVKNPHREMMMSLANALLLDRRVDLGGEFPLEYLDDFKLAAAVPQQPMPQFAPPPRNLIVIVLESTSAQYLSLYGSRFETTPRLVSESQHAVVFDRFYAHIGYTFCSMMPLTYSVYPGPPWLFRPEGSRPMPEGLAALLQKRGYRTGYFSAADPAWSGMDEMAQKAGFEKVFGPDQLGGRKASSWGTEDGIMIDGLIRWIDAEAPSQPFFAFAWTDQTHDPYTLEQGATAVSLLGEGNFPNRESMERYLNAIRQADRHLGRLFDALRLRGLADDTLVVITADHGEAFGDVHDVMGHGSGLFDENLRVPLMLWNPRLFSSARRVDKAGGHVDLNPTLAHILGVDPPSDWQGASLFSEDHPGRVYLQADMSGYQFGVTDGRYKFVADVSGGFERLYELRQDPLEQRDLSAQHPELVGEMRARVSAFLGAEESYLNGMQAQTMTAAIDGCEDRC